jgi:hypothetical protein
MKTMRSWLAVMTLGMLAACLSDKALTPTEFLDVSGTAEFIASVSKSTFAVGDTATLSFALRNIGTDTLRMSFQIGCPILYYIKDSDANFAYPADGAWTCTGVVSSIVLAPEQAHVVTVVVRGGVPDPAIFSDVLLPAGRYRAYAELTNGAGRTNTVPFTIR